MYIRYSCGLDGLGAEDTQVNDAAERWEAFVLKFLSQRFPDYNVEVDVSHRNLLSKVRTDDPDIDPEELRSTIGSDVWADFCSEVT